MKIILYLIAKIKLKNGDTVHLRSQYTFERSIHFGKKGLLSVELVGDVEVISKSLKFYNSLVEVQLI